MKAMTNNLHQTGAALITCLALLVVLTLIGLSSMTSTTLQEKMTGSVYNRQASFQTAEAALREAENYMGTIAANQTPAGTENGFYDFLAPSNPAYPVWDWQKNPGNNWYATNPANIPPTLNTNFQPSYIIEFSTNYQENPNCEFNTLTKSDCDSHKIHRITARSQGLNAQATTVVQSTVRTRKYD